MPHWQSGNTLACRLAADKMDDDIFKGFSCGDAGVELEMLAQFFGVSRTAMKRELIRVGWRTIMLLALRRHKLDCEKKLPRGWRPGMSAEKLELEASPPVPFRHILNAARMEIPHLDGWPPGRDLRPMESREGYLYVLHDGCNGTSKIGCAKRNGPRQRAIMSGHGSVLANVMNVKVADRRAAERQCHVHFREFRRNGEWFNARLSDIVQYIRTEVSWLEIHFESRASLSAYLAACQKNDFSEAVRCLKGPSALPDCRRA